MTLYQAFTDDEIFVGFISAETEKKMLIKKKKYILKGYKTLKKSFEVNRKRCYYKYNKATFYDYNYSLKRGDKK